MVLFRGTKYTPCSPGGVRGGGSCTISDRYNAVCYYLAGVYVPRGKNAQTSLLSEAETGRFTRKLLKALRVAIPIVERSVCGISMS